jgi:hypothetical protein
MLEEILKRRIVGVKTIYHIFFYFIFLKLIYVELTDWPTTRNRDSDSAFSYDLNKIITVSDDDVDCLRNDI